MTTSDSNITAFDILGFRVNPGTIDDYLSFTQQSVEQGVQATVLYHNLHSLYSYFTSSELREHYASYTVLVDGMPLIWLMKALGIPVTREQRVTYVDFIMPLLKLANDSGWTVFHVGQEKSVQDAALTVVRQQCNGIDIRGQHGYFDQTAQSRDSLGVIESINQSGAKIVLVGFGSPRQEAWIHAHRHLIEAPVVFSCGACMEYVAGAVKTPPRWMGKLGLEWSFRLLENPRRFAFRYMIEPVLLSGILLRNALLHGVRKRA